MGEPQPRVPREIDPLGLEILGYLSGNPHAAALIIGGGLALQHYVDFRPTHDIDAWWASAPNLEAEHAIEDAVRKTAELHGYDFRKRTWGVTSSYEILESKNARKVFSFQVASRDVQLAPPRESNWSPLLLEELRDNIGSKMNALVDRGAPRDFLDIYEVISRGIFTVSDCWDLWQRKNPEGDIRDAKDKVLHKISQIEARMPLANLPTGERVDAERRRNFFRGEFVS